MLNIKTLKKQTSYILVFAMLWVLLVPLLAVEVYASTGDFTVTGGTINSDYTYDAGTNTITVTGTVSRITYNSAGGGTGNVVVESGGYVDGDISVNGDIIVAGGVRANVHTIGTVAISGSGTIGTIVIFGDTTIDSSGNIISPTGNIPQSAITNSIVVRDGNLTVAGVMTKTILLQNYYSTATTPRTVTVQNGGEINGGLLVWITSNVNIETGGIIRSNIDIPGSGIDIVVNGDMTGDINIDDMGGTLGLNYQSGTLTGNIKKGSVGASDATVMIGTGAIITGDIDVNGSITVNGMVGGSASAGSSGSLTVNPTGMVNANSIGITIVGVAVMPNVYYPVTTANTVDAPQSTAPASGYIRITTDGAKNILELNNIDMHFVSGTIDATSSTLPLEIYAVGMNVLSLLNHDLPITMTAASGGEFVSHIHTTDTFTMQSGTLEFYAGSGISIHGITASAIVINGGQMSGEGAIASATNNAAAFSVKPTINPPAGMMARIMVAPIYTAIPTEVAESTDYHLNNYVVISFVSLTPTPTPAPAPTSGTTTYNPAIAPLTGVYNN